MPKVKHLLTAAIAATALIGGGVYYRQSHTPTTTEAASPAEAAYQEGIAALKRQDHATAFRFFSQAAEQGHAAAQKELGRLYEQGLGVKQD